MRLFTFLSHNLGDAFRNCVTRFPITVCFALALTAYLCHLVATEAWMTDDRLVFILGYYLSVGTLLSLSLHLWGEEVRRTAVRYGVFVAMQLLLVADAFFLYYKAHEANSIDIGIAHAAGVLAIGISVFFLPFFREKDDILSWNFAQNAIGTLAVSLVVGILMSAGLCLLTLSLQQLFGVEVSRKSYLYILIVGLELLPILLFLGQLPRGEQKHDRTPYPTAFLKGTIYYLFLPLAGAYLLVLYVYACTILFRWELPDGWVSWLVVTLMAGCIAIEFSLYPMRLKENRRKDHLIALLLPALVLPLLLLMTIGIIRRFNDYGITLNRLYLVTLNAWFYLVCIGLIVTRARRISWIPISFSVIFLLKSVLPVNYACITRYTLHKDIRDAMQHSGANKLPLNQEEYDEWVQTLPSSERGLVNAKLKYLIDWFGQSSVDDLVQHKVYPKMIQIEGMDLSASDKRDLMSYYSKSDTHNVPSGYRLCTPTEGKPAEEQGTTGVLTVTLHHPDDTVNIPLETLRRVNRNESAMPVSFRTQRGNVFVLTTFQLYLTDGKPEKGNCNFKGYLYHNE